MNLYFVSAVTCVIAIGSVNLAQAKEKSGTFVRTNTQGQPMVLPKANTLGQCVKNSMALGHPRVGPNGEHDRRGAIGYCRSIGYN
jgi:hypothetical protein